MFVLVMGVCLVTVAWRIAMTANAWSARLIVAGALLLGFGYAVLAPIRETGLMAAHAALVKVPAATVETFSWYTVEGVVMNSGWLLFGVGMALHARILRASGISRNTPAHHFS